MTIDAYCRYGVTMSGKTLISTPFPSAHSVAKELGVAESRAARVIQLMDKIRASDAVRIEVSSFAPKAGPKKKVYSFKKKMLALREKARTSAKARRRNRRR